MNDTIRDLRRRQAALDRCIDILMAVDRECFATELGVLHSSRYFVTEQLWAEEARLRSLPDRERMRESMSALIIGAARDCMDAADVRTTGDGDAA